ncbi:MAG TPA: hypothetical protein DFS52_13590 [Myxococcales bacterium]|nr:hypothetical protein [Myxococcales bacterium]
MRARNSAEPHVGSWKLPRTPVLALVLYAMLAIAAAGAFLASTRPGVLAPGVRLGATLAFGAFVLLFAVYRFALVRARRYPAGKAFFQVGVGVLFLMLLLPGVAGRPEASRLRPLEALLIDADPSVRALACEAARSRKDGRRFATQLVDRMEDSVPAVREEALRSLEALAGSSIGGTGAGAAERWRAWARAAASDSR